MNLPDGRQVLNENDSRSSVPCLPDHLLFRLIIVFYFHETETAPGLYAALPRW